MRLFTTAIIATGLLGATACNGKASANGVADGPSNGTNNVGTNVATNNGANNNATNNNGDANNAATNNSVAAGDGWIRVFNLFDQDGIDACLAPAGTQDWFGPVLANGTPLDRREVRPEGVQMRDEDSGSAYVRLDPGSYDVRIVRAGSDCSSSLEGMELTNVDPIVPDGGLSVIATRGVDGSPTAYALIDRFYESAPHGVVRFINAAETDAKLEFRMGSGPTSEPLFSGVESGGTGSVLNTEGGYLAVGDPGTIPLSVGPSGTQEDWVTAVGDIGGKSTVIATGKPGDADNPMRLWFCPDNRDNDDRYGRARCRERGTDWAGRAPHRARFVGFGDIDEITFCIRGPGDEDFASVQETLQTINYAKGWRVTRYLELRAGTWEISVRQKGGSCDSPVHDLGTFELTEDGLSTFVVWNKANGWGGKRFEDAVDMTLGAATVRVIHLSDLLGSGVAGPGEEASFDPVFQNLEFGEVASEGVVDDLGYARIPAMYVEPFSARTIGDAATEQTRFDLVIEEGQTWTIFVSDGTGFNSSEQQVQLMACIDSALPIDWRTPCRDPRGN